MLYKRSYLNLSLLFVLFGSLNCTHTGDSSIDVTVPNLEKATIDSNAIKVDIEQGGTTIALQRTEFLLTRPLLHSVDSIEKVNQGEKSDVSFPISVSANCFPNADKFKLANPLIFFRSTNTLTLEMNYYFSLPDSIIRLIEYSWEGIPDMVKELKSKFDNNSEILLKNFKQPGDAKQEVHEDWTQNSITWQNETVHVNQFIILGQTTNRVRVLISWK